MKEYKLKWYEEEDKGSQWVTSLYEDNRQLCYYDNRIPEVYHGCHGLVTHNGQYILLSEDDQQFSPFFAMSERELASLVKIVNTMRELVLQGITQWTISQGPFNSTSRRDPQYEPQVAIHFEGCVVPFGVGVLDDFAKVVNGVRNERI